MPVLNPDGLLQCTVCGNFEAAQLVEPANVAGLLERLPALEGKPVLLCEDCEYLIAETLAEEG